MRSEPDMNSAVPLARWKHGSMRQLSADDIYHGFPQSGFLQELSLHSALYSFSFILSVVFLIFTPLINSTSMVQKWLIQIRETHALNKPISKLFNCS